VDRFAVVRGGRQSELYRLKGGPLLLGDGGLERLGRRPEKEGSIYLA
jgi:hypothetical protein